MDNSGRVPIENRKKGKTPCDDLTKSIVPKLCFEDKLDEDFIVILSSVKKNINNLNSEGDRELAQVWLEKLCGEAFDGAELKRSRNIYLTRLACQIPEPNSSLNAPFNEPPSEEKLTPAEITFKLKPPEEKRPDWLRELIEEDRIPADISHTSQDGRTYLATHTMKDGRGAFGYLAVTIADDEPLWVGAGEDISSSASRTSTKNKRPVTCRDPTSPQALISRLKEEQKAWSNIEGHLKKVSNKRVIENIQQLLEKRRSREERDGLLYFYNILLEHISNEMERCGCGKGIHNAHVQHLLEKLEKDLDESGENVCECEMSPADKRLHMLELLYNRTEERKKAVLEREAALDRMERTLQGLTVEDEETEDEATGDSLWLHAIEQEPTEDNMKRLLAVYTPELVERFTELLGMWRQDMIHRSRNRHENNVAAWKKELRAEVKRGLDKYKEARDLWMKVSQALQDVQEAQQKAKESAELESILAKQNSSKLAKGRTKLVNELQKEFSEAQQLFDDERKKGQKVKEQINTVTQRVEDAILMNETAIEQLQADGEALRNDAVYLECELEEQETRIADLDQLLDSIC